MSNELQNLIIGIDFGTFGINFGHGFKSDQNFNTLIGNDLDLKKYNSQNILIKVVNENYSVDCDGDAEEMYEMYLEKEKEKETEKEKEKEKEKEEEKEEEEKKTSLKKNSMLDR
eukprot:Anaeramoba_flamelloidesa807918_24.p1 GENE.a807918_24~~a807918_24.p1  ORF type:complete len:122 (-),score=44.67 a807918_24:83-424(-)